MGSDVRYQSACAGGAIRCATDPATRRVPRLYSGTMNRQPPDSESLPTPPRRARRLWLGAVAVLIVGLCWWATFSPKMVTLTVTLIDTTTNQPCPNEAIILQRTRFDLSPVFPVWIRQLNFDGTLRVTDAQGRVTFECPSLEDMEARSRYQIFFMPRGPAFIPVRQDFSLLQSDQVTIYVKPRSAAAGPPAGAALKNP